MHPCMRACVQNELGVLDIQFLHGCELPTICVLYQDGDDSRHVKTYVIDIKVRGAVVVVVVEPHV